MLTWSRLRVLLNLSDSYLVRHKTIEARSHFIVQRKTAAKSQKKSAQRFVDYKRVLVKGGDGGNGCLSFLSLYANEFAGPDGGDGGNGGHILFKADSNIKSLVNLDATIRAMSGDHGRGKNCHGKNASHTVVQVPIGTMFHDDEHNLLGDLHRHDDVFMGARGGGGGKGNRFYVSAENTAPTSYEEGGKGQERFLHVELRVIAHVGLVGFPNAGKSTLLRALSKARPKVAAYPFTTLKPHIGIIEYDDCEQVAVADIPGLIDGAHLNRGLGLSFLKHIERCICLLYVLDLSQPESVSQLEALKYELEQYKEGLSSRPHAIVANKMDLPMAQTNFKKLRDSVADLLIFPVSAKHKVNIGQLVQHIRDLYDNHQEDMK